MKLGVNKLLMMMATLGLGACGMTKPHTGYALQSYTPTNNLGVIQPAAGDVQNLTLGAAPKQPCSFSSFHRKNAIGYELDDRRQIGFHVSPSVDVFDPSDAKVKFGLTFKMALGGPSNKRPKCTYGSGYYGFVPYAMNDGVNLNGLTDTDTIKSFVQEKLIERERRQKEREERSMLGI